MANEKIVLPVLDSPEGCMEELSSKCVHTGSNEVTLTFYGGLNETSYVSIRTESAAGGFVSNGDIETGVEDPNTLMAILELAGLVAIRTDFYTEDVYATPDATIRATLRQVKDHGTFLTLETSEECPDAQAVLRAFVASELSLAVGEEMTRD